MKKTLFFALTLFALVAPVMTSCGDDDNIPAPIICTIEHLTFNGNMSSVVKTPQQDYQIPPTPADAEIVPQANGLYTIIIHPFTVAVTEGPMAGVSIATSSNISISNIAPQADAQKVVFAGDFDQMVTTSLRGQEPMEMNVAGNIHAELANETLTFQLNVNKWSGMPFNLEFNFTSDK